MGFFASLFGKDRPNNVEVVPDQIWMTSDARFAGIAGEIAARSRPETVAILLVAHFPDVLARLDELAALPAELPVKAVLADNLSTDVAASMNLDESSTIDIIAGERHPLPSVDERLARFANELPCRCRLSHHISLEDPVIRIFAGDWIQGFLGKLGMRENEPLQSEMVSRRIKQAQQKIEGKAFGTSDAKSAAEWLENNCPELWNK